MKIDLHCHTKKTKQGDAITRNVTPELFEEKIGLAGVKIVAITNHNCFDYDQFKLLRDKVKKICEVWPGVELDIKCGNNQDVSKRGHLIVVANPRYASKFNKAVKDIMGDTTADNFIADITTVYKTFSNCDCIYIPHYHKKPALSDEDVKELADLLQDKSRLFQETSDYRSLGVYSNFDYSMIIGSDVQDWNKYEKSTFAEIRLPIDSYEHFCLLAKKDTQVIDTLLNKKNKKEIPVSPYKNVTFRLTFYNDINIIFGQKGTGKSKIIESLINYCKNNGIPYSDYIANERELDFKKLLKVDKTVSVLNKINAPALDDKFRQIYDWEDTLPTSISNYIDWYETRDSSKSKKTLKITNSVHMEDVASEKDLEKDYEYIKEFCKSSFFKVYRKKYLSEEENLDFNKLLAKLVEGIYEKHRIHWINKNAVGLTNFTIDSIKSNADKCSETLSRPSSTGFYNFCLNRLELYEAAKNINEALEISSSSEKEYLGYLEDKGDIFIRTNYIMLDADSNHKSLRDEFSIPISALRETKKYIENIYAKFDDSDISSIVSKFVEKYDEGITNLSYFVGISKDTILEDDESYNPSNGEQGILLMQRKLKDNVDVYILDEPELGMGNSYITASILPMLIDLAKQKKMVIVATHNANIAVSTLPYSSIFRVHENGDYKTYVGNPFKDELINIDDDSDCKNWTYESMHTLEGGKDAFYGRKDIYESGRKDN